MFIITKNNNKIMEAIIEFFDFEGNAALRLYYKDHNKSLRCDADSRLIMDQYGNYNVTGTSLYEAFTPVFMTGNVETAYIYELFTDMPFEKVALL